MWVIGLFSAVLEFLGVIRDSYDAAGTRLLVGGL